MCSVRESQAHSQRHHPWKLLKPHFWLPFNTSYLETALANFSGLLLHYRLTASFHRPLHQTADLRSVLQPHGECPEDPGRANSNPRGHQDQSGGKNVLVMCIYREHIHVPHQKPSMLTVVLMKCVYTLTLLNVFMSHLCICVKSDKQTM